MELAASIGISISEFWDMTPNELSVYAEAFVKRREVEQKDSIYQAYLISRWVWQKRIDIKKILNGTERKKEMTDEQLEEQARILNRLFGGEEHSQ